MTLQELQTQVCRLPVADRLKLLSALVQSLQQELQPSIDHQDLLEVAEPSKMSRSLVSSIGAAQGSFRTADEADQFVRRERDTWES